MKNSAKSYQSANRENINEKRREKYCKNKFKKKGCSRVKTFLKLAKQGPDSICVFRNRCFYPRGVTGFKCN